VLVTNNEHEFSGVGFLGLTREEGVESSQTCQHVKNNGH
jgi:hypothetical protein